MNNHFAILGGMGSLATESFIRLINSLSDAHSDQEYLDYLVFNHASVPNRSAYILGDSPDSPLPDLISDIVQANITAPEFIVLTCNTAHAFFDDLQRISRAEILHMPTLACAQLPQTSVGSTAATQATVKVGFLGTAGSVASGVYERCALERGFELVTPNEQLQARVTHLIDHDVKDNAFLNFDSYHAILKQMAEDSGCELTILGCTELSLLEEHSPAHGYTVIDAQKELALETVKRAKTARQAAWAHDVVSGGAND